jgi:hypothetical protein
MNVRAVGVESQRGRSLWVGRVPAGTQKETPELVGGHCALIPRPIENVAQWQWGDAENAMNKWAELGVTRLQALQAGKQ